MATKYEVYVVGRSLDAESQGGAKKALTYVDTVDASTARSALAKAITEPEKGREYAAIPVRHLNVMRWETQTVEKTTWAS